MKELETEQDLPSKTQRKREADALQEMGERLTAYRNQQLQKLDLPEKLLNAIEDYQRLPNSHGAKRRQLQFIGRVMRDCDATAIETAIVQLETGPSNKNTAGNITEEWLNKIHTTGTPAIEEFLQEYSTANRQYLRQLYRNIDKATDTKKVVQLNRLRQYLSEIILTP